MPITTPRNEDEEAKIIEDIEKYGFPLEVKSTQIIEANGWKVTHQAAFQDLETNKFRTVDIVARKNLLLRPDDMLIEILLVIECKSSPKKSKPWVFYASPCDFNEAEVRRKTKASSQFIMTSIAYQQKYSDQMVSKTVDGFLLGNHFTAPIFSKLGYIPFEAFAKGEARTTHKATMQVCNAILDFESRIDERQFESPFGMLLIPIIITDEHLYTYDGKALNREVGLFYYISYADSAFMFEVMNKSFVSTYLHFLDNQITKFQKSQQ